jgi:hypothetical protein
VLIVNVSMGFQSSNPARRTLNGIEAMSPIDKGQESKRGIVDLKTSLSQQPLKLPLKRTKLIKNSGVVEKQDELK